MKRESLLIDFARKLERELTDAKAEIERLTRERELAYALGYADAKSGKESRAMKPERE